MTATIPSPELPLSETEDLSSTVPKTAPAAHTDDMDIDSSEDMPQQDGTKARARAKISDLLKEKEQEWTAVVKKKNGPLRLLDLPMDVLKEIVKEVTHTNDLTALALTHSALHNLAIPHIYSRFDIVWPDAHATSDPRTGVDALTYGLATLCMGDVSRDQVDQSFTCTNCGTQNVAECSHGLTSAPGKGQRRLGNQYPQFTRKFSLGNGPPDWVQEYLITKEAGKMLGTLVALAVQRMTNLETFVWDMPTGVLGDVWMALASLQSRSPNRECRLERVWVRWHDNSDTLPTLAQRSTTPSHGATSIGWTVPAGSSASTPQRPLSYRESRVEYPTLSVLPPLRSLSVLDIDELDYLDEMSVLIAKSKECLRELRVGISEKACKRDFAMSWDGPDLHQVDHKASWPGASTVGEKRLGGVLGVLLGRVFDIRKKQKVKVEKKERTTSLATATPVPPPLSSHITAPMDIQSGDALQEYMPETDNTGIEDTWSEKQETMSNDGIILNPGVTFSLDGEAPLNSPVSSDFNSQPPLLSSLPETEIALPQSVMDSLDAQLFGGPEYHIQPININVLSSVTSTELPSRRSQTQSNKHSHIAETPSSERQRLEGKLRLQILELERVPLSVAVLQKAFDWSVLTNLTILDCAQHDRLWVSLRRHFQPTPLGVNHSSGKHTNSLQYHLNLKKIHTDAASPALISFLKETLAPNTLETLFLQDRKRSAGTTVTIDAIFRGPLKRHRASIKKLMLDSSSGIPISPSDSSANTRWRAWMPNRDVLNFITSGRMSGLRELSIAVDYKDWHHFLQRLPQIPHLRSLNIPFIGDHVTPAFEPRELAMQVVDVIVLRPEVELCYMGVSHKCFEILENRPHDESHGSAEHHSSLANGGPGGTVTDDDEASDEDGSDEDEEEDEDDDDNGTAIAAQVDPDETESEVSDHDDSDSDSYISDDGKSKVRLRLREILFYDDKVAIFKARHGKL